MADKAKYPNNMSESTFHEAEELFAQRKLLLNRLKIARQVPGCGEKVLGLTLGGQYQEEGFVARIRPYVEQAIIQDIISVDKALTSLGVTPDPIPHSPWAVEDYSLSS